jgi:hypothetical protein
LVICFPLPGWLRLPTGALWSDGLAASPMNEG